MSWSQRLWRISGTDPSLFRKRILGTVFALLGIGIVMVYSSSFAYAEAYNGDPAFYFKRQLIFSLLGILAMVVGYKIPIEFWRRYGKWGMLLVLGLLGLVLVPGIGKQVGGARRWLSLGGINFQPSELAKLFLLIYSADLFSRKMEEKNSLLVDIREMFPVFIVFGIMAGLILLEPDLGTTVVCAGALFCLMWTAGFKLSHLISLLLISLPMVSALVLSAGYRRKRILAFLNPWADPRDAGYQIIQSQIALGSGGILGRGLGKGLQKLFYLPASHTDFIFAVIGEELGLLGTFLVLVLFFYLFVQGFGAGLQQRDPFRKLLIVGIMSLFAIETIINLGVNLGMLPPKGLPLPFVSYGGTAQVVNLFAVGILLRAI